MIKIGEYIRTPYGKIGRITDIPKHNIYFDDGFILDNKHFIECGRKAMKELKSTPNIIDLIEVGDYVNGYVVLFAGAITWDNDGNVIDKRVKINDGGYDRWLSEDFIKSIVTKEKYESIEYRIGK